MAGPDSTEGTTSPGSEQGGLPTSEAMRRAAEDRLGRGEGPAGGESLATFPDDAPVVRSGPGGPEDVRSDLGGSPPTVSPDEARSEREPEHVDSATDPGDAPTEDQSLLISAVTVDRTALASDEPTGGGEAGPAPRLPERIGRYRVRRLLGEGGFGRVYHAWDGELDRDVAVKVPRAGSFVSAKHAEAFVREARLAANLKHPAIVTVHDIGHDEDGSLFVVLEYVEGQSLSDLLRAESVSHRRLAELLALVAEALYYAHSRGLVHRDLKPANLLVDVQGRPHVTDFGLAVHEEGVRSLGRQIAGTLHYMAPEQVRGESHRLDGRTDLWGLGVVLYQMLTRQLPFQGRERGQVFDEIVHRDPPTPRQVNPELPPDLDRICMKCLSKRMSDRYPTALELAADLWHWVSREDRAAGAGPGGATEPAGPSLTTVDTESGSWRAGARVIPKGLRSFDGADEGFFLSLLAGPFDRDGLPEGLRFWKSRVESTDPDEAFPVGLLYGPSGVGKSSLIKAGLIPRLAPHVRPVYVEATPDGTDVRLLRGLRKACPDLPEGPGLADLLRAARESPAVRRGKKLLVVLDQFEQWLHAFRPGRGDGLVEALRQCDGVSVQCLVMARDDFATAATRFMNAVEVPLVEGKNYALVDRFDVPHAVSVLALFGRALGRLPAEGPPSADQRRFLDEAVAGMAENGKVAPVRLAVFVEMFRGKPWDTPSLKRVGGAEGIGVLFLEESLGAPAATSPRRQAHLGPARSVLAALLPAPGVVIKGHMKPYAELLAVSGYGGRPDAFDDLLRVLDGDLRLITPCDPEKGNPDSVQAGASHAPPAAEAVPVEKRSYQLTHDDLVPALKKWLSRKQSETARGRAGLLLENRSSVWSSRPDPRYLPTLPEWAWIALLTRRSDWTEPQARMMRAAARRDTVRAVAAGALAGALVFAGVRLADWLERDRRASQSAALVAKLWVSEMDHTPKTIEQMEPFRPLWLAEVARAADDLSRPVGERTRAHLALARTDPRRLPFLVDRLLHADPPEHAAILDALSRWGGLASDRLWREATGPKPGGSRLLRAAAALAAIDPADPRWAGLFGPVARRLAAEPSAFVPDWAEALRPVAPGLVGPLEAVALHPTRFVHDRLSAAVALGLLTGDGRGPRLLAELVMEESDPEAFKLLVSRLAAEGERASPSLAQELDQPVPSDPAGRARRANVGVALLHLERPARVWPMLGRAADPTVRTLLIHRMVAFGVDGGVLIDRLSVEPDPTARQAILLALGEPSPDVGASGREDELAAVLERVFRDDPESSVHSAAEWLLRRSGDLGRLSRLRDDLKGTARGGWSVNGRGQTMVHVRDPGVGRPFAISAHEVTVEQFLEYRPDFRFDRDVCPEDAGPITKVDWYEALRYCRWLSEREDVDPTEICYPRADLIGEGMTLPDDFLKKTGYRLPTEAEWEFAARSGTVTPWPFGDDPAFLRKYARFEETSDFKVGACGSLKPNPLGLFDVFGNALEWCQDQFTDGQADHPLGVAQRVLRGGHYKSRRQDTRPDVRAGSWPWKHLSYHGFRVVRTLRD